MNGRAGEKWSLPVRSSNEVAEKATLSRDARYDAVGWGCTFSSQHGQAESSCSGMTCSEKQAFPQIGLQYIPK